MEVAAEINDATTNPNPRLSQTSRSRRDNRLAEPSSGSQKAQKSARRRPKPSTSIEAVAERQATQPIDGLEAPIRGTARPKTHQKRNSRRRDSAAPSEGKAGYEVANQGRGPPQGGTRSNTESGDLSLPPASTSKPSDRYKPKQRASVKAVPDDLTSVLILGLRTPPYPDCPICFSSIHPAQPTWSCSPSVPVIRAGDTQTNEQQYCWTTFHVKCIRSWASKSVKDVADAWRTRGEADRKGDWRCPGCQAKREIVPSGYWCFCNSTPEPKPPRLATPHSCANPCSRVRESGCGHPCPLACHPGPCPPCQVTTRLECYCPAKKVLAFRCGQDQGRGTRGRGRDLSCGSVCGRKLACGKHNCQAICHDGPCNGCGVMEAARCWCGKVEKEVKCGEGDEVICSAENEGTWSGRFSCDNTCERSFDCGVHKCQKSCHPPSFSPATCPLSPSRITTCPCGKHPIASTSTSPLSSSTSRRTEHIFSARSRCTSPIPTCSSICNKPYSDCDHTCASGCHTGPCPPCIAPIDRPCRCGATTRNIRCFELRVPESSVSGEILCGKPCTVLRACGRHQCGRLCCPLASLAFNAGKKLKKRAGGGPGAGIGEEQGGLHECDLICGKPLSCGNHTCEERDHRGSCPPCLRSSFEEMVCSCGRTVLDPPIPCGTQMQCNHQCPRPPPPCGHPRTQHTCHEEPSLCPPCPFLATKKCACGKKMVDNVKCSLDNEKVSCGSVCGKLMPCGFHHCERLCHGGECGPCSVPCGKPRKHCLPATHPCTHACHAPSTCPEDDLCQAIVTLSCPCGRICQSVHCGQSTSEPSAPPSGRPPAPKCNNECSIAKRNARLADALGIDPAAREKSAVVSYQDDLISFARANAKFLGIVEKAFSEFVLSDRKTQFLPPMPPERRKFVHDLAVLYRMDTQMVDQEPHRSVRLLRRLDTRTPTPILSSFLAQPTYTQPSLGKLADLRSGSPSWRVHAPAPSTPAQRGWVSTVTRPSSAVPAPKAVTPSGSARPAVSRTSTPQPSSFATTNEVIPDNWEDDI